jgi:hypothetical protein
METQTAPKQKPVQEIRVNHVKLAIWKNDTANGPFFSVTVTRVFKKDDKWERTPNLNGNDLLALAKAADTADSWIRQQVADPVPETQSPIE